VPGNDGDGSVRFFSGTRLVALIPPAAIPELCVSASLCTPAGTNAVHRHRCAIFVIHSIKYVICLPPAAASAYIYSYISNTLFFGTSLALAKSNTYGHHRTKRGDGGTGSLPCKEKGGAELAFPVHPQHRECSLFGSLILPGLDRSPSSLGSLSPCFAFHPFVTAGAAPTQVGAAPVIY
jgi:hypothetical protein